MHEIPKAEHDIPMPKKVLDGRSFPKVKRPKESPWIPFLKSLCVGDSFLVPNRTFQYVKAKTKELDIEIVYKRLEGYKTRVWIYGIPGNRRPVFRRVKTDKLEELSRDESNHCRASRL